MPMSRSATRAGCRLTLPRKKFFETLSFRPVCSPELLAKGTRRIERAADLLHYPLIHFDWMSRDPEAPTWSQWLATARSIDPGIPYYREWDLSFREELHAIDAVVAGQGIAVCSDVVVSRELESGALVKAHALSLPGYGFYLVSVPNHPQQPNIDAFSTWMRRSELGFTRSGIAAAGWTAAASGDVVGRMSGSAIARLICP